MQIKKIFSDYYLADYAWILDKDELWISNARYNGLFVYNLTSKKTRYIGRFISHPIKWCAIHNCIIRYGDELFLFPLMGNRVDIYNIAKEEFSFIEVDGWERGKAAVAAVHVYEDLAYIMMKNECTCYVLSLKSHEILNKLLLSETRKVSINGSKIMERSVQIGSKIYYAIQGTEYVGCFDVETKTDSVKKLDIPEMLLGAVSFFDNNLLLGDAKRNLIKYDLVEEKCKIISFDWEGNEKEIIDIIPINDVIVVIPAFLGRIAVVDNNSGIIRYCKPQGISRLEDTIMSWRDLSRAMIVNGQILISPVGIDSYIFLDSSSLICEHFRIKVKLEECKGVEMDARYVIRQEKNGDLIRFINNLNEE